MMSSRRQRPKLADLEHPYLVKIKKLSSYFPALELLATWMENSYRIGQIKAQIKIGNEWHIKGGKAHITLIEQRSGTMPKRTVIRDKHELGAILTSTMVSPPIESGTNDNQTLKLFLVENIGASAIELLGTRFEIDPLFFREYIERNFTEFENLHAKTPDLTASKKARQWLSVQNERILSRPSSSNYDEDTMRHLSCNVIRGYIHDESHHNSLGTVSITQTRTMIWVGKDKKCQDALVGIVLIDPTLPGSRPLWKNRANWLPFDTDTTLMPSVSETSRSWYSAIVGMTRAYPWFDTSASADLLDSRIVVYPVLHTICAEWFVVCKYIDMRLSKVEEDLDQNTHHVFSTRGTSIDNALRGLLQWRRQLPICIGMVNEMMEDTFPAALRLTAQSTPDEAAEDILCDIKRILNSLNGLQARVDRLQERGIAEMQLEAARESLAESHNLARLSWLATIFIPLTFVSGLFSMTDNVGSLRSTFKTYFSAAVPLAVASLIIAGWGSIIVRFLLRIVKTVFYYVKMLVTTVKNVLVTMAKVAPVFVGRVAADKRTENEQVA